MPSQKFSRVFGLSCGLLLLLAGLAGSASAQRERWERLGQSYVNGRADHDRVYVRNRGTFRAIQFGIKGGAIEFQRVVVHFENSEDQELEVRDRIPSGGRTRAIDLPGNRRRIRSIEFWYGKSDWRSRPMLNGWGMR